MALKHGVVVANITEDTQTFWNYFKRTVRSQGLSYTSALEQAARGWLADRGLSMPPGTLPDGTSPDQPFRDPATVQEWGSYDD